MYSLHSFIILSTCLWRCRTDPTPAAPHPSQTGSVAVDVDGRVIGGCGNISCQESASLRVSHAAGQEAAGNQNDQGLLQRLGAGTRSWGSSPSYGSGEVFERAYTGKKDTVTEEYPLSHAKRLDQLGDLQETADSALADSTPIRRLSSCKHAQSDTKPASNPHEPSRLIENPPSMVEKGMNPLTLAHGYLMMVAWVLLTPLGIFMGRYFRSCLGGRWVYWHQCVLVFVQAMLLAAYVIIVIKAMGHNFKSGYHAVCGMIVIMLCFGQAVLGFVIHGMYDPDRTRRPIRNRSHRWLGKVLVVLGWCCVLSGISYTGWQKVFYLPMAVLVAVVVGVALVGEYCKIRQRQGPQEKKLAHAANGPIAESW